MCGTTFGSDDKGSSDWRFGRVWAHINGLAAFTAIFWGWPFLDDREAARRLVQANSWM